MSILIESMEMSTTYPLTVTIYPDGQVLSETVGAKDKLGFAVPVPPHGDLIERDALAKHITVEWFCGNKRMNVPWRAVEDAPTVIPAEPREEETT